MSLTLDLSPEDLRTGFYALTDVHDVADLLEITHERLIYNIYVIAPSKKYRPFEIPKASGQNRRILSPNSELKIIQQKLNQVLQAVYEPPKTTHGFVIGRSVRSNAELHIGQRYVFNIDLADFFPSINFGRVRGLLMAPPYSLPTPAATVIAQICCFKNELPQGAPTSPIVSNMICAKLDHQLLKLAWDENCIYTRYADDITFSSSQLFFPNKIARWVKNRQTWETGRPLAQTITNNGFIIHPGKVRMQTEGQRQMVTGIVVNERANLPRQYIRQIRAMLHAWKTHEEEKAEEEYFRLYSYKHRNRKYRGPFKKRPRFRDIVKGKIEYLGMVRGKDDLIYLRYLKEFNELAATPLTEEQRAQLDKLFVSRKGPSLQSESDNNLLPEHPRSREKPGALLPEQLHFEKTAILDSQHEVEFDKMDWLRFAPLPLASILKEYDKQLDDEKRCEILLRFFEALTQFVAVMQLSGFVNDEEAMIEIRNDLFSESDFFETPTFGEWARVVDKLSVRIAQMHKTDKLRLYQAFKIEDDEIFQIIGNKKLSKIYRKLVSYRNEGPAHGGIINPKGANARNLKYLSRLEEMEGYFGDFWKSYILISPGSGAKRKDHYHYDYWLLQGEYGKKRDANFESELEEKELYLCENKRGLKQTLHILPFIRIAEKSGVEACYFYSRRVSDKFKFISHHYSWDSEIVEAQSEIEEWIKQIAPLKEKVEGEDVVG